MRWIICFIAVVSFLGTVFAQDGAVGCGGFVQASPELSKISTTKMDFSNIKVKLLTSEGGLTKSTIECAPNGYYFVPVYDRGTFRLKIEGPQGWNFEPAEVRVVIGDDGQCRAPGIQGQDINFVFTGFGLSGKVTSDSKYCDAAGPSGVTVSLFRPDPTAPADGKGPALKLVTSTTTSEDGSYAFANVFPGPYIIQASHPTWSVKEASKRVEMSWDNMVIRDNFVVSGYNIRGTVLSSGEPMLGVNFLLYPTQKSEDKLPCSLDFSDPDVAKPACSTKSDANGVFVLNQVPCGTYKIVPYYKSTATRFDVEPTEVTVNVAKGTVIISEPFKVVGFSVSGKVVDSQGKGVPAATVSVNGQKKAETDANGNYKLEQINVGTYTITATKEHYSFDTLTNHRVSPSVAVLPSITATGYDVCGKLEVKHGASVAGFAVSLEADAKKDTTTVDAQGHYCFKVAPGTYKVAPVVSKADADKGLHFSPNVRQVVVSHAPVLDANFGQTIVTVSGKVKCQETCDSSITVTLALQGSQSPRTVPLLPSPEAKFDENTFIFKDVVPGQYEIALNEDKWCWKNQRMLLQVQSEDVSNIEFVHTGYKLKVEASHGNITLFFTEGTHQTNFTVPNAGPAEFCLKKPGTYTITPKSCYKFSAETYSFATSQPQKLQLTATQYQVRGHIVATVPDLNKLPAITVTARITSQGADELGDALKPKQATVEAKHQSTQNGKAVYEYKHWASLGDQIEFEPKSKDLLFYPKTITTTVATAECPPPVEDIQARPGLFLKGKIDITPLSAAVELTVRRVGDADGQPVATALSAADGTYSVGPLYDDVEYTVSAWREGYQFEKEGNNFRALKLAQITVEVASEDKAVLPGVLVSLSGNSYRNNSVTGPMGDFSFKGLNRGEYFVKPILKEYVFTPSGNTVTIQEGEDKKVSFVGKRVAYSCYGTIKSLNGDPERSVPVEAISATGEYEETQTDNNGWFRLRGLMPGVTYSVGVKTGHADSRYERSSPAKTTVTVKNEDIHGLSFVVFRKQSKFDVIGRVQAPREHLYTLKASIYQANNNTPFKSVQLGPSNIFEFRSLAKEEYVVRVETNLSTKLFKISAPEYTFTPDATTTHIDLVFDVTPLQESAEIASSNFFALLLSVLLAVGGLYHHQIYLWIENARSAPKVVKKPTKESQVADQFEFLPQHLQQAAKKTGSKRRGIRA